MRRDDIYITYTIAFLVVVLLLVMHLFIGKNISHLPKIIKGSVIIEN